MVRRELGMDIGGSHHVEGCFCLSDKFVTQVEWKRWREISESTDEVAFEGLDGPFGYVAAVNSWGTSW